MKYTKGTAGRVFLVRFEDEDILIEKLGDLARKEKIQAATLIFLGALKKGIKATKSPDPKTGLNLLKIF